MQNKSELLQEEAKNSENVFMSDDLKGQLLDEDESLDTFHNSFFIYLSFEDDSFVKCNTVKVKRTKDFYKVCFVANKEVLVSLCRSKVTKMIWEVAGDVIMDIDTNNRFVDYTVKLHDHNIYIYNLKIARDEDGI